jgi:RimJ/RimL family protein N-acetyltransferase
MSLKMNDLHVELSQIDRSDIHTIKGIIGSGFVDLLNTNTEFNHMNFIEWYGDVLSRNKHIFAIRVSKADGGAAGRSWLVGICGITNIDWSSRHGQIIFIMVDKDGHKSTLQNHPASQHAFKQLIHYAFKELCLNKIWISSLSNNNIADVLNIHGFTADGIRRKHVFIKGRYRDESIFSLTMREFIEGTK